MHFEVTTFSTSIFLSFQSNWLFHVGKNEIWGNKFPLSFLLFWKVKNNFLNALFLTKIFSQLSRKMRSPQLCSSVSACTSTHPLSLTDWVVLTHLHSHISSFVFILLLSLIICPDRIQLRFVPFPAGNFLNSYCFSAFLSNMPESLGLVPLLLELFLLQNVTKTQFYLCCHILYYFTISSSLSLLAILCAII